jgi:hypothetical protein
MKKTTNKTLGMWLTATLVTSSVMWVSGQTAITKSKNVKCVNGICTINGAELKDLKSNSAKVFEIQKNDSKNNLVKAKPETATAISKDFKFNGQRASTVNAGEMGRIDISSLDAAKLKELKINLAKRSEFQKEVSKSNSDKVKNEVATSTTNEFTFTGKGSWSDPANWEKKKVPPAKLKEGDRVIIDGSGPCLYNSMGFFSATKGSSLEIKQGKKLYVSNGSTFRLNGSTLTNNGTLSVLSGTFEVPGKEASANEHFGEITTTKLSQLKSVDQEQLNAKSSQKEADEKQKTNANERLKITPSLIKSHPKN